MEQHPRTVMHTRFRQAVILATTAVCSYYLIYRGLYTLNTTTWPAAILSICLYCAEAFGVVSVFLFFVQVWEVSEPPQQPVLEGRTVDIFVPTYNEDPLLLRATLEACRRVEYPHKTYLCDDGGSDARFNDPEKHEATKKRREELQALCDELGATYQIRPDNRHAKAGNLNYAFTQTSGEFIIIFDADHVPEPHFITRLIGYFKDEKLGFIQTPHAFYNFENFQSRLDHEGRKYWEEGQLFYSVIQPGRNKWNCPIFAGSAAMFRRKALEEVGYIATETITEDMHTGMRMNSRGWKSLGIAERMVAGQAAPDITTFHVQRLRWGEGNLSIMAYDNPMVMKGLKFMQRLCYLGSMIHWAGGMFKLFIYLTPIIMLFTGVSPVSEFSWSLFALTIVYLVASVWGVQYASNGFGSVVYGELFCMVNFWTQIRGLMRAIFWRKFQSFVVTSKRGRQSNSVWPFIRPQVFLVGLCVASIIWGWGRIAFGVSDDYFKPILPTFWNCFHIALGVMAARRALWPEDKRYSYRHVVNVPAMFTLGHADGRETEHVGVTVDLTEGGVGMVAFQPMPVGAPITLVIEAGKEQIECTGQVRWSKEMTDPHLKKTYGWRFGVKFDELEPNTLDAVNRLALHYGVSRLFHEYDLGNRRTLLSEIKADISKIVQRKRYEHRRPYRLPVFVHRPGRAAWQLLVTEDIHSTSFAALTEDLYNVGDKVEFRVESPFDPIKGSAKVVRKEKRRYGARHCSLVAFEYTHLEGDSATIIHDLVGPSPSPQLKSVVVPDRKPLKLPFKKQLTVGLAACLMLGIVQMSAFPFIYRDELFLRQISLLEGDPSEAQLARFDKILTTTMNASYPSTDRLVLLMSCLPKVNRLDDTGNLMKFLAPRDRSNLDLQLALAQAFDSGKDYSQAEAEYQRLLGEANRTVLTASKRREFLVAAARASVHATDMDKAVERFQAALKEFPGDEKLRNEFVGVLISAGRFKEVPAIYAEREPDDEGRMLLMSAYAMANDFEAAERESRIIVAKRPDDPAAKALLADMLSYRKNFLQSRAIYERLSKDAPSDPSLRVKMASIALWSRNYGEALEQFAELWKSGNRKKEVVHGYIDAAAGVQELGDSHRPAIEAIFEHLVSEPKPTPIYLARLGWVFERYREFGKSMQLLERAQTLAPKDPEIRKQYFAVLVINGRSNEAMELLGADRDDPEVRKLLIDVHIRKQDFAAAEKECRSVLLGKTDDVNTLRTLADLLSWKGRHSESLELFEKLKGLKPDDETVPVRIAEVTLWSKNFDKALELFQAQLEKKFEQPTLWRDYIDAAAAAKSMPAAATETVLKIAKEPALIDVKDAAFLARLAWVLHRCRETELVAPLLDRALALRPTQPEVKKTLIGGLSSAGRGREALLLYETLPEADRDKVQLIHIHCGMKTWAAAEKETRALLALKPNDLEIERLLADVLSWKGDYQPALEMLTKLREALPKDDTIAVRIAEVTLWSGNPDRAMDLFVRMIEAAPKRTELWSGFADAASALKQLDKERLASALRVTAAVLEKPVNAAPTTMSRLAWALMRAGKNAEAGKLLDLVAAKPPKDAVSRREVGGVLSAAGRHADAVKMFEGLEVTAEDHLHLASMHCAQKNFPAALKECQEALAKEPNFKPAIRQHADVLSWMGKHQEALAQFEQIRRSDPEDKEIAVRIAETTLWSGAADRAVVLFAAELQRDFERPNVQKGFIDAAASAKSLPPDAAPFVRRLAESNAKLDAVHWSRLAWTLVKLDDKPLAVKIAAKAMETAPTDSASRLELAGVLATLGKPDDALKLLDGVALQPRDREQVARLYSAAKRFDAAAAEFQMMLEANFKQPALWRDFVDAAASAKKLSPAGVALAERLAKEPDVQKSDEGAFLSRLAWTLIKNEKKEPATLLLDRAAALPNLVPETRREIAGVMASSGRGVDALRLLSGLNLTPEDRMQVAQIHASLKDFAAAETECRAVLAAKPQELEAERLLADVLSWKGDHAAASAIFERLQKLAPTDKSLAVRMAEVALWSGDSARAVERFTKLLDEDFHHPEWWTGFVDAAAAAPKLSPKGVQLAERIASMAAAEPTFQDAARLSRLSWALIRSGKKPAALPLLTRAVQLNPTDADIRKELAGVLAAAERTDEALQFYKGLSLDPQTRSQLAWLHCQKKDFAAGADECREALLQAPNDPKLKRQLADILSWQGKHRESIALFEQIIAGPHADGTEPLRLAEIALWSGDADDAARRFASLLEADFNRPPYWKPFADAAAGAKSLSAMGLKIVERLAAQPTVRSSEDLAFLSRLSWALVRGKRSQHATPLLDRAALLPNTDAKLTKEFAGVLSAAGRGKQALRLLSSLPPNEIDHLQLATIHASLQDWASADRECRSALSQRPGDPEVERTLADILSWKGEHAKALEIFGRLLTAYPEDATLPRRIAEVTLWSGDPRAAAGLIAEWLDKHPDDTEAIPTFVDAVASMESLGAREKKHATRIAGLTLQKDAERRAPVFYGRLAWILIRSNEKPLASKLLDQVAGSPPNDPSARKEIAGVLAAADRVADALKFYKGLTLTPDDHLRLADWHSMRKDFDSAEKEVRIALSARPDDPKSTRALADVLSWKGDYRTALELLKRLHEARPDDRELVRRLAEISLWKGDGEVSLGWFEKLLDADFAQPAAWPGFLHAAAAANSLTESQGRLALKLFEQSELIESKDALVLSSMAWMLHKLGRDKQAQKVIEQALKLPLAAPDSKKRLAGILEALGRPAEALKLYEGLTLAPDDHLRLAGLHAAQRDFVSAKKSCEAVLAEQPHNLKAKRLLADVLSWKGDYPQALAAFSRLRRETPNDPELPVRIAETMLWARQYDQAMDQFADLIEANPKNAALRVSFVDAAASASKYSPRHQALAVKLADAVATDEQVTATYCSRLAWALHQVDDKQRVHRLLDLAISKAPQEPSVRRELAGMLTVMRRTREAAALFDGKELELEDRLKLAGIHAAASEFHKAEAALRDALESEPDDPRTLLLLGDVLTWQRKHSDAGKVYAQLLAKGPGDRDVQLKLAQAALWSGQHDLALERIGEMLRKDPQAANLWPLFIDAAASAKLFDPQVHKGTTATIATRVLADANQPSISLPRLAWVLRRSGDLESSAAVLRRALALNPEVESIRLKYAETLSQAGKFAEAREQYDMLLRSKREEPGHE
jgi:tetratricopeptide (TPR) repeat protein/cellulose synthase/poly-beta-1,6-N-acetylglucosamine synthase-like glycosyltransferase